VQGYLKRLATSGAAYQASSLLAGFLALFTLPLYTRHLTEAEFGYA
jgi:O-antigen/teichoic acid export membrane protein